MRFDLTHASYRVLQGASHHILPMSPSEITAAKLILALFEEEECRAADWLRQAGLSFSKFCKDFELNELLSELVKNNTGFDSSVAKLQTPISAPPFAVGNYGVPPEAYQSGRSSPTGRRIETDSIQDKYYSAGSASVPQTRDDDAENPDAKQQAVSYVSEHRKKLKTSQEPDDWVPSGQPDDSVVGTKRFYSVLSDYHPQNYIQNTQSQARFYLDDQLVQINRLAADLESSLEIVASQFSKRGETRAKIPTLGGGITTISTRNTDFQASAYPLATEHLLLAASYDEKDVGLWLRQNGFETNALYQRIEKLSLHQKTRPDDGGGQDGDVSEYSLEEEESPPPPTDKDLHQNGQGNETGSDCKTETDVTSQNLDAGRITERYKIDRLIDATGNRAREALRVLEDFARFLLDDPNLTRRFKGFRHELCEILAPFSAIRRLSARDTRRDVGTEIEGAGEYHRPTPQDVLTANFSRLQESLRSLEEFSKLEDTSISRRLERLRYESYTLHKELGLVEAPPEWPEIAELGTVETQKTLEFEPDIAIVETDVDAGSEADSRVPDPRQPASLKERSEVLSTARLYALLDCKSSEEEFTIAVRALISGDVDMIQLRDKQADDRMVLLRGKLLRKLLDEHRDLAQQTQTEAESKKTDKRILFIMNDRPDLARLSEADGVHVGQDELTVADVRHIVGPDRLIGVSTHDISQARLAVLDGADYIGVGPIFDSTTKIVSKIYSALPGLDFARQVAAEIIIPAFAIGGITLENLSDVLQTQISRVAIGAALFATDDPARTAALFVRQLADEIETPSKDFLPDRSIAQSD